MLLYYMISNLVSMTTDSLIQVIKQNIGRIFIQKAICIRIQHLKQISYLRKQVKWRRFNHIFQ